MDKRRTFWDKCIRDRDGNVALAQKPNLPVMVWFIAWLLSHFVMRHGAGGSLVRALAYGALFTWAWLELFQGVNYVRRALGLVVLAAMLSSAALHTGWPI